MTNRRRWLTAILACAAMALFSSCSESSKPVENPQRLTLQPSDLPKGTEQIGEIAKLTPDKLGEWKEQKKISEIQVEEFRKLNFEVMIVRSFHTEDGREVISLVTIFKREKDAASYYRPKPSPSGVPPAPKFGDDSFTEQIVPTTVPGKEQLVGLRTRMRIGRVISDVSETGTEINREVHFDLVRKAVTRVTSNL